MTDTRVLAPWPEYSDDEIAAVADVLRSGHVNYWTGTVGQEFERAFAGLCGSRHAVALANGTAALELALRAGGISSGDEVVVTPRSFVASASCVALCGAVPVFADIDKDSQNIGAETISAVLTDKTRAVILVHHAGWPCEMDAIMELAREHDLLVIEDCAQAHGATYKGRHVGGIGHIGAFSFCQDKIMSTGGEGGMLVTDDEDIFKRAWSLKEHGKNYDTVFGKEHPHGFRWLHESLGTNWRMTEMQAAIGMIQLKKLSNWHGKRLQNAKRISESLLQSAAVHVPEVPIHMEHAYYRLYAFVSEDKLADGWSRDRIFAELDGLGIPCSVGSCPEIYNERFFVENKIGPETALPVARSLGPKSLAFLVHPTLTAEDLDQVCSAIQIVVSRASA